MITDPQFDWLAQKAHFLAGTTSVFLGYLLHQMRGALICGGLLILFALIKEFWYDQNYEDPEERGSNLRDFMYYFVGVNFALYVIILIERYQF